jgi:hypothetical protein
MTFKLYYYYSSFINNIKVIGDKNKLFNFKINSTFKPSSQLSEIYVKNILININDTILKLYYNKQKNKQEEDNINKDKIKSLIILGLKSDDKTMFILMYRIYLTERLFTNNCIPELELELLKIIPYNISKELYTKMVYQIRDIQTSYKNILLYRTITCELNDEKYKQCNMNAGDLKRDKFTFYVKNS